MATIAENSTAADVEPADRALGAVSVQQWWARARRTRLRYHVVVVAPTVADVVSGLGGWLFDKAVAGWSVTALVDDHRDEHALAILGATILDLDQAMEARTGALNLHVLAVHAGIYLSDNRIRDGIATRMTLPGPRTTLVWGEDQNPARVAAPGYRLSAAARAFKSCALEAVGSTSAGLPAVETMRTVLYARDS